MDEQTQIPIRHDWSLSEIESIYTAPLLDLLLRAQQTHRTFHVPNEVQGCALLSIKTGACPEDCAYCPQSATYSTNVTATPLLNVDQTIEAATRARGQGATRFCMGAAWGHAASGRQFERVLDMVRGVRALGLEACCTLGMLTQEQADALSAAGLSAYNHNLDTSREFYSRSSRRAPTMSGSRRWPASDRRVSACAAEASSVWARDRDDRYRLLHQLATLAPHPESVPVNLLVAMQGTPLGDRTTEDPLELVRMIATTRVLMPQSYVRLSAGRLSLSDEAQVLCFLAGANSVFPRGYALDDTESGGRHRSRAFRACRDPFYS